MRLVVRRQPVRHGLDLLDRAVEEDPAGLGDVDCSLVNLHCLHSGGPRRRQGARPGLPEQ